MMTKWICKGCRYRRCYVDDPNERIVPNQCPDKGITNPCWKRDCTTEEKKPDMEEIETRIEKYKRAKLDALFGTMGRQLKEQECKIQELITAGQGQMARIQALEKKIPDTWVMWSDRVEELEYRVKSLQNAHFQAQLHAHTWRLEEIEKRVRQLDGHTHERFQCDV
jgi:hypothetical protein